MVIFLLSDRKKGSEKTLNIDDCCIKSMSRLVLDDLMSSLNTCSSLTNDILLGHKNTSVYFVKDSI